MVVSLSLFSTIRSGPWASCTLAGLALILGGCRSEVPAEPPVAASGKPSEQAAETEPAPSAGALPRVAVGRADLLAAFARAADATAAGRPLPDANRQLIGRTFTLKLPFGCSGEASKDHPAWAGWTFGRNRQSLKLAATPERWTDADWVKSIAGNLSHEAVEGFWIERPWTSSEECPARETVSATPSATGSAAGSPGASQAASDADQADSDERQTVGVAQFFVPNSPRTFQRGSRAYAHTIRVREPADIEGRTYHLALSGRVTGYPDGQPIHCVQESPDRRPVCLMAVEWARVSFEDPRDGSALVEWRN
ncbi:MAG: hypothetical protein WCY11_15035 [Novosphingobium sp.]